MSFKKSLSWVLIISQIAFASASFADPAPSAGLTPPTPEMKLLTSLTELTGERLSPPEAQAQMASDFAQYNQDAPLSGRNERMQSALVDIGMFTPGQAQQFVAQSQASVTAALSGSGSSTERVQALENTFSHLAVAQGAEFSLCSFDRYVAFYGLFIGGAVILGVGLSGDSDVLSFSGVISLAAALFFSNDFCD